MTAETFIPAGYHGGDGNLIPIRLVIHATNPGVGYPEASAAGMALSTARYFQSPSTGGSAHHVADVSRIVRCLPDTTVAYHAPPNTHSLGYEICGEGGALSVAPKNYTREQWLSPEVWPAVMRIALQVQADAIKYGIPRRRMSVAEVADNEKGICGHVDVSQAFHQSDHTDPGPDFPWDRFMTVVTGGASPEVDMPAGMAQWWHASDGSEYAISGTKARKIASPDERRALQNRQLLSMTVRNIDSQDLVDLLKILLEG